jgi:5'-deoxynucleotidase YfbR-like HD superfamily hydrolase
MISMRELLLGQNARLRNVIRFSNCTRHHQESVAEHSYFVVFYCIVIGMELELEGEEFFDLLMAAAVHDLEEAVSGDILHSFKYSHAPLTKALKESGKVSIMAVLDRLDMRLADERELYRVWLTAKDGPTGDIVKLADVLSTIGYVCREIRAGNESIKDECLGLREFLQTHEKHERLVPFIIGALSVLKEVGL